VTTTHLEYYSAKQRAAQVEACAKLQIEAAGHAAAPVPAKEGPFRTMPRPASGVLTADFNFPPEDAAARSPAIPLAAGVPAYRDAWQLRHPGKAHAPTIGVHDKLQWPGPSLACDFIFVTEDLAHASATWSSTARPTPRTISRYCSCCATRKPVSPRSSRVFRFVGGIERSHPAVPEQEIEAEIVARFLVVGVVGDEVLIQRPSGCCAEPLG